MKALDQRERAFVENFVLGDCVTVKDAAVKAGYTENYADVHASKWLNPVSERSKPHLIEYYQQLLRAKFFRFSNSVFKTIAILEHAALHGEIPQSEFYGGKDSPPIALDAKERLSYAKEFLDRVMGGTAPIVNQYIQDNSTTNIQIKNESQTILSEEKELQLVELLAEKVASK